MVFGRINAGVLRDVCWRGDLFFCVVEAVIEAGDI
jgi:hypothetical protein